MTTRSSMRSVLGLAFGCALILSACSSGDTSSTGAVSDAELPVTFILVDEDGPENPQEMFAEASNVVDAILVDVIGGNRYYGPDTEAPDSATFEEIGLVFEPIEVLSGEVDDTIEVQWTAYTTTRFDQGAQRQMRVETNGLIIDESSIGERFAVFASDASIDGELRPLTSSGLIPLNESGEISGTGSGVFSGTEGLTLAEALEG